MLGCDQNLQAPWVGRPPEDDPYATAFDEPAIGTCWYCGEPIYYGHYDFDGDLLCGECDGLHEYLDKHGHYRFGF